MPLLVLGLLVLLPLAVLALMPLIVIQRYRAGTARRLARPWLASFNAAAMVLSAFLFLVGAAITSTWVADAFVSALRGLAVGCALGIAGLYLSRWESTPRALHYTPNRWLVLLITCAVSARVLYGFWRSWLAVRAGVGDASWVTAFGVAGSLAVGGVVLGYYLAYGIGLQRRIRSWQRRPLRPLRG